MTYTFVAVLLIVTAVFLGDALRRLRNQIINQNQMQIAKKTMRLHVFVMFFHSVTFTICNVTLVTSNFLPSSEAAALAAVWNTTKILMFIAQSISQLIIMYLIRQLSKPIVYQKKEIEEDDIDESEASSFAFLLYVKKDSSAKMVRPPPGADLWASRNDLLVS